VKKKQIVLAVAVAVVAIGAVVAVLLVRSSSTSLRLGATFPLTGDVASYGQSAKHGIELAVAEANERGGVLGRPVEVDFQDDRNESREAVSIVTRFATVDGVPVVFGSAGSTATLAVAPIANRHHVLLVSPISSSARLSTEGGPYFFRTCPADDLQAQVLARWVLERGIRRVAVVYTNNSWGQPLAEGFRTAFVAGGGTILLEEGISEGATDTRGILTRISGLENVEAIVSATYPREGGVLVRQAAELGLAVPMYGGDNWGSPEFRTAAGDAANGVFYTAPVELASPAHAAFASAYRARFGADPDVFAAYAYDAANAVFRALEAAGSTDPERVRGALLAVSFEGASGRIRFKPNGDIDAQAFARRTIRNGAPVDVGQTNGQEGRGGTQP